MTRRVILPVLFQLYKAARICYLRSFRVAMASRRRPAQLLDEQRAPCNCVEIVGPAFDPNRVLLRRVTFLNDIKSKYVSVWFYPAQNYQPLFEFGGTKLLPLVLTAEYVPLLAERLPCLVEATCRNEQFQWWSEDKVFRMNSTGSYRFSILTVGKHWISFKLHELRNLLCIFYVVTNQLPMYTAALGDIHAYVNAAMASDNYVEPALIASRSINCSQLFEELKSPCSNIPFNKLWLLSTTRVSSVLTISIASGHPITHLVQMWALT